MHAARCVFRYVAAHAQRLTFRQAKAAIRNTAGVLPRSSSAAGVPFASTIASTPKATGRYLYRN